MTRACARLTLALLCAAATTWPLAGQAPVFRSNSTYVSVNVAVKRGNRVIASLTARDFRLLDNGVEQTIEAVSIEAVPVDVTLFLDTSGSTAGRLDDMKRDVQGIIQLLRRGDRFRLLTIGDSVYEPVVWVPAGTTVDLSFEPVGGISLIHDALSIALLHRPDPDRRHLIVGMTDRQDCGSVIPSGLLRELAGRSEAVLHLVEQSGGERTEHRVRTCSPTARPDGPEVIRHAAERTGGELHVQSRVLFFRSGSILGVFRRIFDDFRQSYVLRYAATGVEPRGWHTIEVQVPSVRDATIRARKGYYGSGS
ncbi:MAG TPA: hypothetical protein VLD67_20215 [Vicinamibacterales bacterium]|nr:hypothetical protein [Vicinamibacterales bacterium]